MLQTPRNKPELLVLLKHQKDFSVLAVSTGKAYDLISDLRKFGTKPVSIIILGPR